MRISDWSSDVCSSDLDLRHAQPDEVEQGARHAGGDIAMGGIEAANTLGGGGFVIETAAHGSAPWLGSTDHRRTGPGFCESRHFVTGGRGGAPLHGTGTVATHAGMAAARAAPAAEAGEQQV